VGGGRKGVVVVEKGVEVERGKERRDGWSGYEAGLVVVDPFSSAAPSKAWVLGGKQHHALLMRL